MWKWINTYYLPRLPSSKMDLQINLPRPAGDRIFFHSKIRSLKLTKKNLIPAYNPLDPQKILIIIKIIILSIYINYYYFLKNYNFFFKHLELADTTTYIFGILTSIPLKIIFNRIQNSNFKSILHLFYGGSNMVESAGFA